METALGANVLFLPAHPAAACPWVGGGRWSSDGSGSRATGFRVQGAALNGTVVRDDFFLPVHQTATRHYLLRRSSRRCSVAKFN